MGLLSKTNPKATAKSVCLHAALAGFTVPAFFFAVGKSWIGEEWHITLPILTALGASIGALVEWQIDDSIIEEKNGQR